MKSKVKKIIIIAIALFCGVKGYLYLDNEFGFFESDLYKHYKYYGEDFYGEELYSEIDYKCSDYEVEIGNMLVDKLREVAAYVGPEEEADYIEELGELNEFYIFNIGDSNAVSQEVSLEFITCKIDDDEGHVWVVYTRDGFDKNGEWICGSFDCLMLWYIEKIDDEWVVVRNREQP